MKIFSTKIYHTKFHDTKISRSKIVHYMHTRTCVRVTMCMILHTSTVTVFSLIIDGWVDGHLILAIM